MKVNPIATPIDALVPPRSSASDEATTSFPETLREARAGTEGNRSREELDRADRDSRTAETDRAERADRSRESSEDDAPVDETSVDESAQSEEASVEDTGSSQTVDGTTDGEPTLAALSPFPVTTVDSTAPGTGVTPTSELPATAVPISMSTPLREATAHQTLETAQTTLPTAGQKAALGENASAEEVALDPKTQNLTTKTASTSAVQGPAEGETAVLAPRGEVKVATEATTPLSTREGIAASTAAGSAESSWFRPGEGKGDTADRASFHLLDGEGSTAAESRSELAIPRTPAAATDARSTQATSQTRIDGVTLDSGSPSSTANGNAAVTGPQGSPTGSAAATRAAAEVISGDLAEPSALARRIFRQVRRSMARGDQELNIRLDPPRLGRVDVDLKVDAEKIGIRFVVETEEVRDVLRAHIDDLHRSLESTGWSSESVEIDLREGSSEGESSSSRPSGGEEGTNPDENGENSSEHRELRLWHLGKTVDLKG